MRLFRNFYTCYHCEHEWTGDWLPLATMIVLSVEEDAGDNDAT
jgi:hypothetical protein